MEQTRMDRWLDDGDGSPARAVDDVHAFDAFGNQLVRLQRVFGPLVRGRPRRDPPRIAVGEITSSARRDVGALELIARLRARAGRGQTGAGGLAWYTPTGLVRYAVVAPDQSRMLWSGNLGRIADLAGMSGLERERAIRALIAERTGQEFRDFRGRHRGADLQPRPGGGGEPFGAGAWEAFAGRTG